VGGQVWLECKLRGEEQVSLMCFASSPLVQNAASCERAVGVLASICCQVYCGTCFVFMWELLSISADSFCQGGRMAVEQDSNGVIRQSSLKPKPLIG
jgi:hypothetical protein